METLPFIFPPSFLISLAAFPLRRDVLDRVLKYFPRGIMASLLLSTYRLNILLKSYALSAYTHFSFPDIRLQNCLNNRQDFCNIAGLNLNPYKYCPHSLFALSLLLAEIFSSCPSACMIRPLSLWQCSDTVSYPERQKLSLNPEIAHLIRWMICLS